MENKIAQSGGKVSRVKDIRRKSDKMTMKMVLCGKKSDARLHSVQCSEY